MIRYGNLNDYESIKYIEKKSFGKFSYSDYEIKEMLKNTKLLVYEIENKPVGYLSFFFEYFNSEKSCHIESIAVLPKYRKMGIGGKLLKEYEKLCSENFAKYSILEVRVRNYNAIKFYKKNEYKILNLIKNYYSIPYRNSRDAYLMIKEIKS